MWCLIDFVVLHAVDGKCQKLTDQMGPKTLSEFVKLFDLTLGLEAWLNRPEFSSSELEIAGHFIKKSNL